MGLAWRVAKQQDEVWAILGRDEVIARREHPELGGAVDWLVRRGRLKPVLPGVYATSERSSDVDVRIAAVAHWDPDAVIVGAASARLGCWPDVATDLVEVATSRRGSYRGYRLVRRVLPPELVTVRRGVRFASPALAALDLAGATPDMIDHVLRTRSATLEGLWAAFDLTRGRRDNAARLRHLVDSRDEPSSAAERLCHRLLRDAGLTGWESNLPVRSGGRLFYIDVAFALAGVAVEIDGRLHEDDPDVFENDRERQNSLVLDGWVVLRFTWAMLTEQPDEVVQTIRAALASADRTRPLRYRRSICREADSHPGRGSRGRISGGDPEPDAEHEDTGP
jgi:very-short-patch-repair endonuclease